jgi:transcriptional regulator with XRE-family HTH domain
MSIDSLKNRIQKRKLFEQKKQDYSDIGSVIKKRRKELNKTQDEIAKGICSISYLSKIENNQIIPSEWSVREIMSRLEIDSEVFIESLSEQRYLRDTIQAFYDLDDTKMRMIYEMIAPIEHNVTINLCKLAYTVYFEMDDDKQYVMMLEHLVNNMTDLEIAFYLYLSALYFVSNQKYKVALELVTMYTSILKTDTNLEGMVKELSYRIKLRLFKKSCAALDYRDARELYTRSHNLKRLIRLSISRISEIAEEHPNKALDMLNHIQLDMMSQTDLDWVNFLKAKILIDLQQYQEASMILKEIDVDSPYYFRKMTALYEICLLEGDENTASDIENTLITLKPHKREIGYKIRYHYLTQKSSERKKEYLRDIAIPVSIRIEDYKMLFNYTMDIMQLCMEGSRYKEATSFFQKYQKELEKINRILS